MVYFCCVNGCRNNDHKDLNVSFHAFPHNTNLKRQWLKAIGRPNWSPPSYARVCGAHFAYGEPGPGIGISNCPVNISQTHSNYEATEEDVCYFCLNSDVKMYSLEDETLKMCYESVVILNNSSLEGLPKFICYECKANLLKCYNFIQKSMICQATIKEIFEEHGQINKFLANSQNREGLNLTSSLRCNFVTPTHLFEYKFDEDRGTSQSKHFFAEIPEERDKSFINIVNYYPEDEENIKIDTSKGGSECKLENQYESDDHCNIFNENEDFIFNNAGVGHDHDYSIPTKEDDSDNKESEFTDISQVNSVIDDDVGDTEKDIENSPDASPISGDDNNDDTDNEKDEETDELEAFFNSIKAEDLEPLKGTRNHITKAINIKEKHEKEEKEMEKTFNIVKLSLQEQKEQFKKSIESRRKQTYVEYRCDTCSKVFLTLSTCKKHVYGHDPNLRGVWECPVCLLRFRNREYLWLHSYSYHNHLYRCKSCPYSSSNRAHAMKHSREHAGYQASCPLCPFKGKHPSSVTNHVRSQHKEQAHTCDKCGVMFVSTAGLKVHMKAVHDETSNETDLHPCEKCGINFKSEYDKLTHLRTSPAHSNDKDVEVYSSALKPKKKKGPGPRSRWYSQDNRDGYPKKCDHCDLVFISRGEHWRHVQTKHRDMKHAYRPLVRVVCDVCGKGLQSRAILKTHLLQHGPPLLACADCPRMFHDKYALARHVYMHRPDRPHRCDQCSSAFRHPGNLIRHKKVHSDVTPYECKICFKKFKHHPNLSIHVKTVHCGMPHPPRKKRTRKKKKEE